MATPAPTGAPFVGQLAGVFDSRRNRAKNTLTSTRPCALDWTASCAHVSARMAHNMSHSPVTAATSRCRSRQVDAVGQPTWTKRTNSMLS